MARRSVFYPVGTGPYELDTWNQTDFVKVKKFAGYWQPGLPKLDSITWRPVADNNTRRGNAANR